MNRRRGSIVWRKLGPEYVYQAPALTGAQEVVLGPVTAQYQPNTAGIGVVDETERHVQHS